MVEQHKVNIIYTAPTALRALMKEGDSWPNKYDLSSLRMLGTVGEPIKSPEWHWYFQVIGKERARLWIPGGRRKPAAFLLPHCLERSKQSPAQRHCRSSASSPVLLMNKEMNSLAMALPAILCIKFPWPGIMRTVYGDHERFRQTYFAMYPGKYFTGDGCRRDEDGYYWITGRVDDVINVSGHRIGTAEVEGAIGKPSLGCGSCGCWHAARSQRAGDLCLCHVEDRAARVSRVLTKEINDTVRHEIGPHATPDKIQFTDGLTENSQW